MRGATNLSLIERLSENSVCVANGTEPDASMWRLMPVVPSGLSTGAAAKASITSCSAPGATATPTMMSASTKTSFLSGWAPMPGKSSDPVESAQPNSSKTSAMPSPSVSGRRTLAELQSWAGAGMASHNRMATASSATTTCLELPPRTELSPPRSHAWRVHPRPPPDVGTARLGCRGSSRPLGLAATPPVAGRRPTDVRGRGSRIPMGLIRQARASSPPIAALRAPDCAIVGVQREARPGASTGTFDCLGCTSADLRTPLPRRLVLPPGTTLAR